MVRRFAGVFLAFLTACSASSAAAALPEAPPEELGFDPKILARVDAAVGRALAAKTIPGAVVLVGREAKLAFVGVYGDRARVPAVEAMTRDTVFDLASLTKPLATAASIMILIDRGRLRLDDRVATFLPELANRGKEAITVEHLLRHRSGLVADNPIEDYADGPVRAWERVAQLRPMSAPGEAFRYSDVGFLILGRLVERIADEPLDQFTHRNLFEPLGMDSTGFLPLDSPRMKARGFAPADRIDGAFRPGVVHDPRARALGGVAGHAGLFGTADDVAVFASMMLAQGVAPGGKQILGVEAVRGMIDPGRTTPPERRGLGWDIETAYSAPRGKRFGPRSYGHTGFTGTSLWIDPETRAFVVLLTSRLHPNGKAPAPTALRSELATIAAEALGAGGDVGLRNRP